MCSHSFFLYSPPFQQLYLLWSFNVCGCILVFASAPLCCTCGCWWFCCGCSNDGDYCNGGFDDFVDWTILYYSYMAKTCLQLKKLWFLFFLGVNNAGFLSLLLNFCLAGIDSHLLFLYLSMVMCVEGSIDSALG